MLLDFCSKGDFRYPSRRLIPVDGCPLRFLGPIKVGGLKELILRGPLQGLLVARTRDLSVLAVDAAGFGLVTFKLGKISMLNGLIGC